MCPNFMQKLQSQPEALFKDLIAVNYAEFLGNREF